MWGNKINSMSEKVTEWGKKTKQNEFYFDFVVSKGSGLCWREALVQPGVLSAVEMKTAVRSRTSYGES